MKVEMKSMSKEFMSFYPWMAPSDSCHGLCSENSFDGLSIFSLYKSLLNFKRINNPSGLMWIHMNIWCLFFLHLSDGHGTWHACCLFIGFPPFYSLLCLHHTLPAMFPCQIPSHWPSMKNGLPALSPNQFLLSFLPRGTIPESQGPLLPLQLWISPDSPQRYLQL